MKHSASRVAMTHYESASTAKRSPAAAAIPRLLLVGALIAPAAAADVHDLMVTDVTPYAFSVIWISDDPVADAGIRVYTDPAGDPADEITGDLAITLVSEAYPPAHAQGIVKLDVVGLQPDSRYFFEVGMTTADDPPVDVVHPGLDDPLLTVDTAVAVMLTQSPDSDEPIANDLYLHGVYLPDGETAAPGTVVLIELPEVAAWPDGEPLPPTSMAPLSAFVAENGIDSAGIIDLNNLFSAEGLSFQAQPGQTIRLTEFRGGIQVGGERCRASEHKIERVRRIADETDPRITEVLSPEPCFSPFGVAGDFDCDRRIGLSDVTRLLSHYGADGQDCRFNSDFNLFHDGDGVQRIDLSDLTRLLTVYQETETP